MSSPAPAFMSPLDQLAKLLPLELAMPTLTNPIPLSNAASVWVRESVGKFEPSVRVGLWLYVDDIERAHQIAQSIPDETGSAWHAIIHRREGDFSNSLYWWHLAGPHPALQSIPGYQSEQFVSQVKAAGKLVSTELVEIQRQEWAALFSWCVEQSGALGIEGLGGESPDA